MTPEVFVWAAGFSTVIALATTIWNIVTSGSRQNARRIGDLETRVTTLASRVERVEGRLDQLPDKEVTHKLELAMARIEGHIDRLDERLRPVAAIAERMQEILIEQGRK